MPILPLALPSQSNQGEQPHTGSAALINAYAVPVGTERKSQILIRAASGLVSMSTLDAGGGIRGLIEVDGLSYAVAGRILYSVDPTGFATQIGGIPSDGYVGMARNQRDVGVQTCIVCDGLSWITVGTTATAISDLDLPPAIDVCCINQSFIFVSADGRMIRSEINDGFAIDGLDIAEAESAPDGLFRGVDQGSNLIAIGSRSTEVWQDVGAEAFGFTRANVISVGAVGPRAVTKATVLAGAIGDTVAWIATDQNGRYAGVVMLAGYTPQKISTAYIDRIVDQVADKSSIVATSWVERGRAMISWRLPTTTIVYDTSTQQWHERRSRDALGNEATWRVSHAAVMGGRVLVGDATAPKLYWLDPEAYDEAGSELVMTVRTPPLTAFPGRIECNHIYLDVVPGVGRNIVDVGGDDTVLLLASGGGLLLADGSSFLTLAEVSAPTSDDSDPVVTLRKSHDGVTWGAERARKLGQRGQRMRRVSWTGLGTFDAATFELSCSAAVGREILSAGWDGRTLKP